MPDQAAEAVAQPSLMETLKQATATQHAAIERAVFAQALVQGRLSRMGFESWLQQRYLLHAALEAHVEALAHRHHEWLPLIEDEHRLAAHARASLAALGVDDSVEPLTDTARCLAAWQAWSNEAPLRLLGAHYVFEGSKNGGRFVCRAVERAAPEVASAARLYLDPHGGEQRAIWQRFRTRMEAAAPADEAARAAIIAGAQETFDFVSAADDGVLAADGALLQP